MPLSEKQALNIIFSEESAPTEVMSAVSQIKKMTGKDRAGLVDKYLTSNSETSELLTTLVEANLEIQRLRTGYYAQDVVHTFNKGKWVIAFFLYTLTAMISAFDSIFDGIFLVLFFTAFLMALEEGRIKL